MDLKDELLHCQLWVCSHQQVMTAPDHPVVGFSVQAQEHYGCSSTLGNAPGVRTWVGNVESVPAFQVARTPVCSSSCCSLLWRTKLMYSIPLHYQYVIFLALVTKCSLLMTF